MLCFPLFAAAEVRPCVPKVLLTVGKNGLVSPVCDKYLPNKASNYANSCLPTLMVSIFLTGSAKMAFK
jgi:hypothetical protein